MQAACGLDRRNAGQELETHPGATKHSHDPFDNGSTGRTAMPSARERSAKPTRFDEWQISSQRVKGSKMIRVTLSKLKAWFSPGVSSNSANSINKSKMQSNPAPVQIAGSAKKTKRKAQRQARARNR